MRFEFRTGLSALLGFILSLVTGLPAFAGNPDRDAYFGETHVHTSWSLDAFAIGNVLTNPGDAYKYFKGEPIKHPLGYDVKIDTPLDWAGVTDHSEYAGVVNLANEPGSFSPTCSSSSPQHSAAAMRRPSAPKSSPSSDSLQPRPPII